MGGVIAGLGAEHRGAVKISHGRHAQRVGAKLHRHSRHRAAVPLSDIHAAHPRPERAPGERQEQQDT